MSKNLDSDTLQAIKAASFDSTEEFYRAGDEWLRKSGVITDIHHNALILNFYVHFPRAKYLEYFMNQEDKQIELYLHYGFFARQFVNHERLQQKAQDLLKAYLPDYSITVTLQPYRKKS